MEVRKIKKLQSKRNNVFLVELKEGERCKKGILKEYSHENMEFLEREYDNLQFLEKANIPVPKVIFIDDKSLILEYIEGEIICDLVENLDMGNWIDRFAQWMALLHGIKRDGESLLKLDVNLRNFIYNRERDIVYGLDFEEMVYGDVRRDIGNICFFILTNEPPYRREKNMMMKSFLRAYEVHGKIKLQDMGVFLRKAKKEAKYRRLRKASCNNPI